MPQTRTFNVLFVELYPLCKRQSKTKTEKYKSLPEMKLVKVLPKTEFL